MTSAYLLAFSAVLAVSAAQSPVIENRFIEAPMCNTWSPIGTNFQPLSLFPFQLKCTPSDDGRSVEMSISAPADSERGAAHIMVAAVTADGTPFIEGEYEYPGTFRTLTCNDKTVRVVKIDVEKAPSASITYNLPEDKSITIDDVHCRFFIAENLKVYWQDITVPAVVETVASGDEAGVETETGSGEEDTEIVAGAAEGALEESATDVVQEQTAPVQVQRTPVQVQPAPVQVQRTPVQVQPTQPAAVDPVVVETAAPDTKEEDNFTEEPEAVRVVDTAAVTEEDGSLVETPAPTTPAPAAPTTAAAAVPTTPEDDGVDDPPAPNTDVNEGKDTDEFMIKNAPKDANGREIIVERDDKKAVSGQEKSGYWCGDQGNVFVMAKNTDCRMFYQGIMKKGEEEVASRGSFTCAPGTQFNSNLCQCTYPSSFVCPEPNPDFAPPVVETEKVDTKEDTDTINAGEPVQITDEEETEGSAESP